jgi:hypothetical protein
MQPPATSALSQKCTQRRTWIAKNQSHFITDSLRFVLQTADGVQFCTAHMQLQASLLMTLVSFWWQHTP